MRINRELISGSYKNIRQIKIIGALDKKQALETSVRFEVFMAVTMKNGVFWDVIPCGSCEKSSGPNGNIHYQNSVSS
jgi:hypothetical protein